MVGVKKAFIRSVESILAILLFIAFYNIATQDLTPSLPRANPTIMARELLNSMEQSGFLEELVNSYSLRELSTSLKYLLPPNQGFKIEMNYLEPVIIKNSNNEDLTRNMSFIRMFPETTNLESVNLFDENNQALPVQIINNYYRMIITTQPSVELKNETLTFSNVNLVTDSDKAINTTSLRAYVNNKQVLIELDSISYNNNYYDANASIKILIPHNEENNLLTIYLFYASDETSEVINYPNLGTGLEYDYSTSTPIKSKASQVVFTESLQANEEKIINLYYELNTESERIFEDLSFNNEGVTIIPRVEYYPSTLPFNSYQSQTSYNARKTIITSDLNCLINLKVWNYE